MGDLITNLKGIMNIQQEGAKTGQTQAKEYLNCVFNSGDVQNNDLHIDAQTAQTLMHVLNGTAAEPNEKQKAARKQLDEKVSSTGMKYKDAQATISKLKEHYGKDKKYQSTFESKQSDELLVYIPPYKAFDPYKIPEPAKSEYFEAIATMQEIEGSNSALLQQSGLQKTETPSKNYATGPSFDEF